MSANVCEMLQTVKDKVLTVKKSLKKVLHTIFCLINYPLLVVRKVERTALFADR